MASFSPHPKFQHESHTCANIASIVGVKFGITMIFLHNLHPTNVVFKPHPLTVTMVMKCTYANSQFFQLILMTG